MRALAHSVAVLCASLLGISAAASAAPAQQRCPTIPGADRLLLNRNLRWIIVGEVHGTNETPVAFADLVCAASKRRPVVAAVEQTVLAQPEIDAFISSDGSPSARAAFLKSQIWNQKMKDGRSSEAYFRLFERLREMRASGQVKRVVAFQPAAFAPEPGVYEKLMADALMSKVDPNDLVVALSGNLHARLTPFPFANPYKPMAGNLPVKETATLDARPDGGSTWACMPDCGPHSLGNSASSSARAIVLDGTTEGYTGVFYLGVPATPSVPQNSEQVDQHQGDK